jgi:Kef-type K+ transport system membrane component KefB
MEVIEPINHHHMVVLLLQLGVLLLVARLLGEIAVRFDLPSVVGELLAGVVVGPSILGTIAPGVFEFLVPQNPEQFHLLEVVSFLGVLMLLIVTGLETDVQLIMRKGRNAAAISFFGIAIPFATGFALGEVMPASFIADEGNRLVFSLFIATAMSISAIPVIAKVMIEMNVVRRDIGQVTLAAGMIDDTIGWILLSIVAGLARSGQVSVPAVIQSVLSVLLVVGLAFTAGRKLIPVLFRAVDNRVGGDMVKITLLMTLALLFGAGTHALGIEAVLGAFITGILVGQVKRFDHNVRHIFETVAMGVFAPIFFAASGLRVDLALLAQPRVFVVGMLVLGVAIFGKFVGAALGAKLSGMGRWEALSLGAGMNARGAIEIIVATIGLSLGVLTPEMYSIILMVAIVTSLMAPPILRWALRHIPMSDEERERLEQADRRQASFVGNLHRVLLPSRGGANSQIAAQLLDLALRDEDVEITTMYVAATDPDSGERSPAAVPIGAGRTDTLVAADPQASLDLVEAHLDNISNANRRRLVEDAERGIVETVLGELTRGYDLLALGATEPAKDNGGATTPLFSDVVDALIQEAPCPVLVVSNSASEQDVPVDPIEVRRILVPSAGSDQNRHALEVAFAIARSADATVELVHIVERSRHRDGYLGGATSLQEAQQIGQEVVGRDAELAHQLGVTVRTEVIVGDSAEAEIVKRCQRRRVDLVVLSSNRRAVSQRAFFGHRVDHVLRHAPCPVAVVS